MAKSEPVIEISADLLQRLHRIYRQRNDLQGQIDRCPRQIAAGESQVQKCHQAVADAIDATKRTKMAADQKQLQLKERENRLDNLQGKLNAASSNREYDLLKEQIAADKQANSVLSDEILELLERIDQLEIDRSARQAEVVDRVAEHEAMVKAVNERLESLKGDLAQVEAERVEAEALVPAGAKQEYERLVAARGEDALAPVDGDTCGGCYQMLTTQIVNRIRLSQLVRCPACNAFLYTKKP
jgi:predicted  nucleic acid-binding Zn-ribbon protein